MLRKSDVVREAIKEGNWKKALRIAKDFRINVSKAQRDTMTRAYECMTNPRFYVSIGMDIERAIETGKGTLISLYG